MSQQITKKMKSSDRSTDHILKKIEGNYHLFSKANKKIATFIIKHYQKAAFMNANSIASEVGVSESTVVRFPHSIGLTGYPSLQRELQELIKTKLTTVQRVDMSQIFDNDLHIVQNVLKSDMQNIKQVLDDLDQQSFEKVVDLIISSHRIYIVGLRSSAVISSYLRYYLDIMLDNIILIENSFPDVIEKMVKMTANDLMIGISFPRYTKNTFDLLSYGQKKETKIIAITDSRLSPIASIADQALYVQTNMAAFVDSLVAPLSLINALIVAVGMRRKDQVKSTLDSLESAWNEFQIYE